MSKPEIDGILRTTTWCINAKKNMWGMPIWGDTVRYYCKITKVLKLMRVSPPPPKFAGRPQHLNDHDLYNTEVSGHLVSAAVGWEVADHDVTANEISGTLESLSEMMESELVARGSARTGGTHAAWTDAVTASENGNEHPGWYLPFSMAEDGQVRKRSFPIKGKSASQTSWIDKIASALSKR